VRITEVALDAYGMRRDKTYELRLR
jgi:hypothetical protein